MSGLKFDQNFPIKARLFRMGRSEDMPTEQV